MPSPDINALAERAVAEWGAQQKPAELASLGELILRHGYRTLLEVGTYAGGTARFFAALGLDVTAVDVDLSHVVEADGVRYLQGGRELADSFCNQSFDVVFIDADHSYASVTFDWHTWGPKAFGIVVLHDIREHRGNWGGLSFVDQLWTQIKADGARTEEFVVGEDDCAGIGVVEVDKRLGVNNGWHSDDLRSCRRPA